MDQMIQIARSAMEQMPPQCRVRASDAEIVLAHREVLLSWESEVVKGFYDTLFAHAPTSRVFVDGERTARELTLSDWWRRTVNGPLDDDYFAWMALVGLVHVLRRVSNPMMLAMADFVRTFVVERSGDLDIDPHERARLIDAFGRLASTVSAIITYAYDHAVASALFEVAGMPGALLERLCDQEISAALTVARADR